MLDLNRLQYGATDEKHIVRRIRRMRAADRQALRERYERGSLDIAWGDTLIYACMAMGWRVR